MIFSFLPRHQCRQWVFYFLIFYIKNLEKLKMSQIYTRNFFLASFFVKKWQIFTKEKKTLSVGAGSLAMAHHHYHHSK